MTALLALESPRATSAILQFGAARGQQFEVAADLDEAIGLARFRRYSAVICDASFAGAFCARGLDIARAAKHADPHMRTIVLTTRISAAICEARMRGEVDVIVVKPIPLATLFSHLIVERSDRVEAPDGAQGLVVDLRSWQERTWENYDYPSGTAE